MIPTNNKNFVWNETIGYSTKYVFQNTPVRYVAATAYISPSFANYVFDIFNTRQSRSEGVVKCGLGNTNHTIMGKDVPYDELRNPAGSEVLATPIH